MFVFLVAISASLMAFLPLPLPGFISFFVWAYVIG